MLRIGLVLTLITGIFFCIKAITTQRNSSFTYYKITSIKASHINEGKVKMGDEYYLMLQLSQDMEENKKRLLSSKQKPAVLKCRNQIREIKIFSTEKINEAHLAGADLANAFDFHYIRNMETKYGIMIKEGITIPISEFQNFVDQDNDGNQLKELRLRLNQKPVMKSEHQFIVSVIFENGEVKSDTTECISFEGVEGN